MSKEPARMGRPTSTPRGDNIVARLRRAKGWDQKQTAEALGVGQSRISEYETGKVNIPAPIQKLAAVLLGESNV